MRCGSAEDCYFFQECTEHWSGAFCPGACEVSNWFKGQYINDARIILLVTVTSNVTLQQYCPLIGF